MLIVEFMVIAKEVYANATKGLVVRSARMRTVSHPVPSLLYVNQEPVSFLVLTAAAVQGIVFWASVVAILDSLGRIVNYQKSVALAQDTESAEKGYVLVISTTVERTAVSSLLQPVLRTAQVGDAVI